MYIHTSAYVYMYTYATPITHTHTQASIPFGMPEAIVSHLYGRQVQKHVYVYGLHTDGRIYGLEFSRTPRRKDAHCACHKSVQQSA